MTIQVCAMVDGITGRVVNLIMADPETDKAWPGHSLVAVPDVGHPITTQWAWSKETGFFLADPDVANPLQKRIEEDRRAAELRPYLLGD